jgi:diguanylate cyclase (GGDEF)-like protein
MNDNKKAIESIEKELDRIWDCMIADPSKALEDSLEVEKLAESVSFDKGVKEARFYQGWCMIFQSRLKEAIEILTDLAMEYKQDQLNEDNIKILNALGVAYSDIGDNNNAFYFYSQSLKLSREANLLDRELSVLNNMGGYYLGNNNYETALKHYLELLEKAESNEQSPELLSVVMSNIGNCYYKLDDLDLAERFFLESRTLARKISSGINESEILFDLAQISIKKNRKKETESYINQALDLCRKIDNRRLECDIYIFLGDKENDVAYYVKALELSRDIDNRQFQLESSRKLADYYESLKEFEEAYRYLKDSFRLEKEINNQAAEKKFRNLEMEYEIERNKKSAEFFKTENLELKESLNWMTLLNKIARETISSLDRDSIISRVFYNINLLMEVTHFHVVLYDKNEDRLNVIKAYENEREIAPFSFSADGNSSFAAWVIKNRQVILLNDIDKEYKKYVNKKAIYGKGPTAKSILTVPIVFRNDEIGALAILSRHKNVYKEEHIHFLKSLASFLAIAIENSRNYQKVKELNKIITAEKEELESANKKITELATHDNLTGLINRRVLFELLEASMEQARRRGEILAVLFIDLDDFKPINDTWGHDGGDKVLKEIASRLKKSVRSTDSVARIGGDEFLILLNPVKNKSEARMVSEKIIDTVAAPIELKGKKISVSMSLGISTYPEEETTAEQLIINADSAMYSIKKGEKNGICFYEKNQEKDS